MNACALPSPTLSIGYVNATNGAIIVKNAIYKNLLKYINVNTYVYITKTKYNIVYAAVLYILVDCALNLTKPIILVLNLTFPSSTFTVIPSSILGLIKSVNLSVIIKSPDIIKCIKNTKHNATTQFCNDSLYFALSDAVELIKILIPRYTKTDSNPTIAIFLNEIYQSEIVCLSTPLAADSDA